MANTVYIYNENFELILTYFDVESTTDGDVVLHKLKAGWILQDIKK